MLELANVRGIANYFGVTPPAVSAWESRYADYPAPLDMPHVAGIPLWDFDAVKNWHGRRLE